MQTVIAASVVPDDRAAGLAIAVVLDCVCDDPGKPLRGDVVLSGRGAPDVLATLRPVPFADTPPGTYESWQLALAVLDDAFDGEAPLDGLEPFADLPPAAVAETRREAREPLDWSVGARRYFEALGTIAGGRSAVEWNALGAQDEAGRYRYRIDREAAPWQLDLRAAVRDAVFEILGGEAPAIVSARFQNTVAFALADLVRGVAALRGRVPVVLEGSCFRTAGLAARIARALGGDVEVRQRT